MFLLHTVYENIGFMLLFIIFFYINYDFLLYV
jgi:hypothetical protein